MNNQELREVLRDLKKVARSRPTYQEDFQVEAFLDEFSHVGLAIVPDSYGLQKSLFSHGLTYHDNPASDTFLGRYFILERKVSQETFHNAWINRSVSETIPISGEEFITRLETTLERGIRSVYTTTREAIPGGLSTVLIDRKKIPSQEVRGNSSKHITPLKNSQGVLDEGYMREGNTIPSQAIIGTHYVCFSSDFFQIAKIYELLTNPPKRERSGLLHENVLQRFARLSDKIQE